MRKLIAALALTTAVIFGTGSGCSDTGNAATGGKPRKVKVYISPGSTTITKAYFGLWSAGSDATSSCKWTITKSGKVVQHGGAKDKMIIAHGVHGGVVHLVAACGKFSK